MLRIKTLGATLILLCSLVGAAAADYQLGIDVSHWQGNIAWQTVAAAGYEFAFIKATEGVGYTDPKFSYNIANATATGMKAGPYHFATPYTNDVNDAAAEAEYFYAVAGSYMSDGYLRPVLDLESGYTLGKSVLSQWIRAFMARVEELSGVEPIIYCNQNYAANYFESSLGVYDVWFARWTYDLNKPPGNLGVFDDWAFWQYSNQTSVPGISGNVDGDVCRGNLAAYVIPEPGVMLLIFTAGIISAMRRVASSAIGCADVGERSSVR